MKMLPPYLSATLILLFALSTCATAAPVTISTIEIDDTTNSGIWKTQQSSINWALGVSTSSNGKYLFSAPTANLGLTNGNYFFTVATQGTNYEPLANAILTLKLGLSNNSTITEQFKNTGTTANPTFVSYGTNDGNVTFNSAAYISGTIGVTNTAYNSSPTNDLQLSFSVHEPSILTSPIPGAIWLFGTGLIGLLKFRKRVVE